MPRLRAPFALLALLLAAGCGEPGVWFPTGIGDPVRAAALAAPFELGDTSHLAGDPARAARATAQLELVAQAFREDPLYMHVVSGWALNATRLGRAELREAIGIDQAAPPGVVIAALREAALSLDEGDTGGAAEMLSAHAFPLGGATTLGRLGTLPRLPRVAEAASAASREIHRIDSLQGARD
jgi:hypothetical protein